MMQWVEPMMWGFCRIISDAMTFIGLIGLLYFAGRGLIWFTNKTIEEEYRHDED